MHSNRLFTVAVAVAFLLAGCSSGEQNDSSGEGNDSSGEQTQRPTLKDLTGDELCRGLPESSIERVLGGKVGSADGVNSTSDEGPHAWVRCGYVFDSSVAPYDADAPIHLVTNVSPAETPDEVAELNQRFTDADGKPQPFESVADLGLAAGFGKDPEPGTGLEPVLVVVFEAGQQRYLGELTMSPEVALDKLTPLAGELVKAIQAELE